MQMLKQSTAATILVGPVLDSAGAAVTTAVIGDFQATKNGTSAALASPATATHSHNGFYLLALTTGNTDTVGRLVISVNNTAQSMSTHRYTVLLASVYDALITNATNTSGGLPAATGAISALAGAVSTYAGGDTAGTTTLLTRLPSAISLSSGAVTVGTNNDKTGYSLTAGTGLGNQTANITGNLSGSVGSVTGAVGSVTGGVTVATNNDKTGYSLTQAFPPNFAALGINSSGHVLRVTLVDTTTTNTDMRGTDNAALASAWTATRAGYLDGVLIAANYNQRTVQVTGSNHVAADIHALQAAVITDAAFAAGWLTAAGTAADYVTELQTALGTATNQTAILDRVSFALSALTGSCSDAQTAAETYVLSIGGNTYTVDYSGLDASGNRSTTTLTKA